ncbi:hypothetical protein YTPLAS73_11070 [Nitrosarchaeum sp.]|nr:hypothetical protein YTPLAS73_11070 [Nitrosarchaeum sp.]
MKVFSDQKYLYIKFTVLEKILGIHGSFRIPLQKISEIHSNIPKQSWKEIRCPGTFLPGMIKAGTYLTDRGKEFWYVTRKNHHIVIELKQGFYNRIILSVNKDVINKIKK